MQLGDIVEIIPGSGYDSTESYQILQIDEASGTCMLIENNDKKIRPTVIIDITDIRLKEDIISTEFKPAKSLGEVEARLKDIGVAKVDLGSWDLKGANAILKAVEQESKFGEINLSFIGDFSKKDYKTDSLVRADGFFKEKRDGDPEIKISRDAIVNSWHGAPPETVSRQEKIKKLLQDLISWSKEKPSDEYPSDIIADMKSGIKANISRLQETKAWSIAETQTTLEDKIFSVTTHELGHYRNYAIGEADVDYAVDFSHLDKSPTDYGMTNKKEYFAEWFVKFRMEGPEGVPSDLLSIFNSIPLL